MGGCAASWTARGREKKKGPTAGPAQKPTTRSSAARRCHLKKSFYLVTSVKLFFLPIKTATRKIAKNPKP